MSAAKNGAAAAAAGAGAPPGGLPEHVHPLHSNILVRIDPPRERVGLIHLPERSQTEIGTGTVVAVGLGWVDRKTGKRREMDVRVGDRVAYEVFRAIEKLEEDAPSAGMGAAESAGQFELDESPRESNSGSGGDGSRESPRENRIVRYTIIQERHVLGVLEDEQGERIEVLG